MHQHLGAWVGDREPQPGKPTREAK
jgi:hypothetical protein